ncbi:hypothetical protein [Cytobacillus gottheilii]|uniref:hypothetical protein n=1 Tax=Cytobacillus gottheilii TaxID=859144 RepID=UPI003464AE47
MEIKIAHLSSLKFLKNPLLGFRFPIEWDSCVVIFSPYIQKWIEEDLVRSMKSLRILDL